MLMTPDSSHSPISSSTGTTSCPLTLSSTSSSTQSTQSQQSVIRLQVPECSQSQQQSSFMWVQKHTPPPQQNKSQTPQIYHQLQSSNNNQQQKSVIYLGPTMCNNHITTPRSQTPNKYSIVDTTTSSSTSSSVITATPTTTSSSSVLSQSASSPSQSDVSCMKGEPELNIGICPFLFRFRFVAEVRFRYITTFMNEVVDKVLCYLELTLNAGRLTL